MNGIVSSLKQSTHFIHTLQKQLDQKTGKVSLEGTRVDVRSRTEPMTLRHIDTWAGSYAYHQTLETTLFQPLKSLLVSDIGEPPSFLQATASLQNANTAEEWVQSLHAWVSECHQWDTVFEQTKQSLQESLEITLERVNVAFKTHESLMNQWKGASEGSEQKAYWMHQSEECRLSLIYDLGITARPDQKGMPEFFEKGSRLLETGRLDYQNEGFVWVTDQNKTHPIQLGPGVLMACHEALTQKLPLWRQTCASYVTSVIAQCNAGYAKGCHKDSLKQTSLPGLTPETLLTWKKPLVWAIFEQKPEGTIAQETITLHPPIEEEITLANWIKTLQEAIDVKAQEKGFSKPSITWDQDRLCLTQQGEQRWMCVEGIDDPLWSQLGWGQCLTYGPHDPLKTVRSILTDIQACHTDYIASFPSQDGMVYGLEPGGLWTEGNKPQRTVSEKPWFDLGCAIMQELTLCEASASQVLKPLEDLLSRYQERLGSDIDRVHQMDQAVARQQLLFKLYELQKKLEQDFLNVL